MYLLNALIKTIGFPNPSFKEVSGDSLFMKSFGYCNQNPVIGAIIRQVVYFNGMDKQNRSFVKNLLNSYYRGQLFFFGKPG